MSVKSLLKVSCALCCSIDKARFSDFSLAKSAGSFTEQILQVFKFGVEYKDLARTVLAPPFSTNTLTNKRKRVRRALPKGTTSKQRESGRCGYHFF